MQTTRERLCASGGTIGITIEGADIQLGDGTFAIVSWQGALEQGSPEQGSPEQGSPEQGSLEQDDPEEDLIVRLRDSCGNWGECEYSVYLACEKGRYLRVYGPEYSVGIEAGPFTGAEFRDLRELRRHDAADTVASKAAYVPLRFRRGAYEEDTSR